MKQIKIKNIIKYIEKAKGKTAVAYQFGGQDTRYLKELET